MAFPATVLPFAGLSSPPSAQQTENNPNGYEERGELGDMWVLGPACLGSLQVAAGLRNAL